MASPVLTAPVWQNQRLQFGVQTAKWLRCSVAWSASPPGLGAQLELRGGLLPSCARAACGVRPAVKATARTTTVRVIVFRLIWILRRFDCGFAPVWDALAVGTGSPGFGVSQQASIALASRCGPAADRSLRSPAHAACSPACLALLAEPALAVQEGLAAVVPHVPAELAAAVLV